MSPHSSCTAWGPGGEESGREGRRERGKAGEREGGKERGKGQFILCQGIALYNLTVKS